MNDSIENLLLRYFEGDLSTEDRKMVEQWIESSEENEKISRQIQLLVLASDTANVIEQLDVEKALSKTNHRITFNKVSRLFRYVERAAVILLIPLLAVMFTYYFNKEDVNEDKVTVSSNPGTITKLTLSDGTIAYLNSNSNLSYPSKFARDFRAVDLEGEAFFEVTKNAERPFIVNLKNHTSIEVRGTKFNVQANADYVITTLVEGKVRFNFLSNGTKQSVDLNPGQLLRYGLNDHQLSLHTTNCKRETCWKEGLIIFENTPVNEVFDLLSKKFCVDFIIRNPESQNFSFTGSFKDHRLEQILDCISFSSNIKWRYIIDSKNKSTRSQIEIIYKP